MKEGMFLAKSTVTPLSEIQKYFIGAAETDNTDGDYVDPSRGREKLMALLSFCQN